MPNAYVDPILGNDAFNGLSSRTAKASFAAGEALVGAGETLYLLPGDYYNAAVTRTTSMRIVGLGHARLISTENGIFWSSQITTGSRNIILQDLVFEDYDQIVRISDTGLYEQGSTTNTFIYAFNVTAYMPVSPGRLSPASAFALYRTGQGYGTAYADVYLRNVTLRNFNGAVKAWSLGNPTQFTNVSIQAARNCIFDSTAIFNVYNVYQDGGNQATMTVVSSDYNAYNGCAEPSGVSLAGADLNTIYEDLSSDIYAPKRSPASPLLEAGTQGDHIGATFWPCREFGSTVGNVPPVYIDWTGWENDERWYDTLLDQPGPDAVAAGESATASPAFLTSADPRTWVIHPTIGGGGTARAIGPVCDMGNDVGLEGVDWWGEEDLAFDLRGSSSSNGTFASTDETTGDLEWTAVTRTSVPADKKQYWQPRVTLTDGA